MEEIVKKCDSITMRKEERRERRETRETLNTSKWKTMCSLS